MAVEEIRISKSATGKKQKRKGGMRLIRCAQPRERFKNSAE
jgi:hypothetical protein